MVEGDPQSTEELRFVSTEASSAREVLSVLGVEASRTRCVRRGRNTHWIVRTASERVVLRKYAADCGEREVAYELQLLAHLDRRGWPVPMVLRPPVRAAGAIWCLFSYLPGRGLAPRSRAGRTKEQRQRGRLLARLHADMADLAHLGQRSGWLRTDEGLFERRTRRSKSELFREYERRDPVAGRLLRQYSDRASQRLTELSPHAPDPIVIHGDFAPWNLRYRSGELVGVLDFDVAHLDLRVADFALSWRGRHDGVIEGYEEVSPLGPIERELLVPIYWAWMTACAAIDIEEGNGSPDWALEHLQRQPTDAMVLTA